MAVPVAAPSAPSAPSAAVVPRAEVLPGLKLWLAEAKLSKYLEAAERWVDEQGACSLDEVEEVLDDFATDLGFKALERQRLEKVVGFRPIELPSTALPVSGAALADASEPGKVEDAEPWPAEASACAATEMSTKTSGAVVEAAEDFPQLGGGAGVEATGRKGKKRR